MAFRLRLLLLDHRLPRILIALVSLGIVIYALVAYYAPAAVAPDTEQISNITWTSDTVSFDYQAAKNCPSLNFHSSYRDSANQELRADDTVGGHPKSAGVRYHETLHLAPGTTVPAGTTRIVITTFCTETSPTPS